jgi:hypothetical protein
MDYNLVALSVITGYVAFVLFQLGLQDPRINAKQNYFEAGFWILGLSGGAIIRIVANILNIARF